MPFNLSGNTYLFDSQKGELNKIQKGGRKRKAWKAVYCTLY